jgi:hypothetical protein
MSDSRKENLFATLAARQNPPPTVQGDVQAPATEELPPCPTATVPAPAASKKGRGSRKKPESPKGKRGNPAYCQANAYVPKTLRRAVDKALLDIEGVDYSTLITDLLRKWLKSRGASE